MTHTESHRIHHAGWLRAAVMGANDGIVSCASLIIGVAAAGSGTEAILLAGIAGLVAGAMSMAAGEYVSVSSQADTELADLAIERRALAQNYAGELAELAEIYVSRGLDSDLAHQVAEQLMAHDALGAHARDEIGISDVLTAKPLQAALSSGLTFTLGSMLPLIAAWLAPRDTLIWQVAVSAILSLAILGVLSAKTGGAPIGRAVLRVVFWGALAMAATAGVGWLMDLSLV